MQKNLCKNDRETIYIASFTRATTTEKPSILRVSREQQKNLADFKWISVLREMKERVPDVLKILVAIAAPRIGNDCSQVAPFMYCIWNTDAYT